MLDSFHLELPLQPTAIVVRDRVLCLDCGPRYVKRERPLEALVVRHDPELAAKLPDRHRCAECGRALRPAA